MDCKGEDVKLRGTQRNNDNASHLSSDDASKSEDKDNASKEGKNNANGEGEDNVGEKGKDDTDREGKDNNSDKDNNGIENNNGEESKNDAGGNGEILNIKLDGDEILNLGEIIASKLAFCCIANFLVDTLLRSTVTLDYLALPLVVFLILLVSGFHF